MDVLAQPTVCPKCGGTTFYDNTQSKKSARGPDYKCKNCGEGFWLKGVPASSASGTVIKTPAPRYRDALPPQPETPPVDNGGYAGNGAMDYPSMGKKFLECLETAIVANKRLLEEQTGDDPRAIAQMTDTLFIQRMKMGI